MQHTNDKRIYVNTKLQAANIGGAEDILNIMFQADKFLFLRMIEAIYLFAQSRWGQDSLRYQCVLLRDQAIIRAVQALLPPNAFFNFPDSTRLAFGADWRVKKVCLFSILQ